MNKYNWQFKKNEKMYDALNEFELNLILFNIKRQVKHFLNTKEDVNNHLVITYLLLEYCNFPDKFKKWCKKNIIDRISVNWLYGNFLTNCSNNLLDNGFDFIERAFNSYVELGLIKSARIIDGKDHKEIEIITPSNDKIRFSHVPLERELIDEYRGYCHAVTSTFMREANINKTQKVVVALEDKELVGRGYHSFIVDNGVMYDFAHNTMMRYKDYLKLVKHDVLVYEDSVEVLDKMKKMEEDKDFASSEYVDILKYGISKQLKLKRNKYNNNIKNL